MLFIEPNLIQNGSNGFMVSKVDPIDFAEKIIKIIENNQTYLTFSNKYKLINCSVAEYVLLICSFNMICKTNN